MMKTSNRLERFEKIDRLGEGTYGVVYKAKDKNTGDIFALKKIRLTSEDEGIPSTAIREIALLKELNHPNIVKLHEVIHHKGKLVLVLEFVEQDLKKFMSKIEKIDMMVAKSLIYQLLKGIAHCHSLKILHRDIKPQNLLVSKDGVLKLVDFGLARATGIPVKNYTHEVVTLWYRPPDVLLGSIKYSTSIDIWSVGCIFAELITLKPLFGGKSEEDQMKKILKGVGTPNIDDYPGLNDLPKWKSDKFEKEPGEKLSKLVPGLDDVGLDLLDKMLKFNPAERISGKNALNHPWFSEISEKLKKLYK